jgi:hypothetical protein
MDVALNFLTTRPQVPKTPTSIAAKYLTTWFVVDSLALLPFERFLIQPLLDQHRRRHFLLKVAAKVKGTWMVLSRKKQHGRWLPKIAKMTGYRVHQILRFIIRYAPKYWLFWRTCKAIVILRVVRQVRWFNNVCWNVACLVLWNNKKQDDDLMVDDDWYNGTDATQKEAVEESSLSEEYDGDPY